MLAHMSDSNNSILYKGEETLLGSPDDFTSVRKSKGYHTRKILPDDETLHIFLEAARKTRDWRRLDRSLKITEHFGFFKAAKAQLDQGMPQLKKAEILSSSSEVFTEEDNNKSAKPGMLISLQMVVGALLNRVPEETIGLERHKQLTKWYRRSKHGRTKRR